MHDQPERQHPHFKYLIAAIILGIFALTVLGMFAMAVATRPASADSAPDYEADTYALALQRVDGDGFVGDTTYISDAYGIGITFPADWSVGIRNDGNALAQASSSDGMMLAVLATGKYPDISTSSLDAFHTALWRVNRNVLNGMRPYAVGVPYLRTEPYASIDGAHAALMQVVSYDRLDDGTIQTDNVLYMVFGHGPVYYTLSLAAPNIDSDEELHAAMDRIARTIRIRP